MSMRPEELMDLRILVVDDEPGNLRVLERLLVTDPRDPPATSH